MGTKKIPQKNDLVLVVVNNITNHGIYCDLKEYDGITAYCHISEIAGTFIRNIRNFVKVGQNTVAKVLRVSPENNQVDISLKRVNDSHKRDKIQEYKRQNAAIAICKLIAEKLGKTSILVRDVPGFATSRLGVVLGNEAIRMLADGVASASDIDTAMRLGYRHPMGPLELTDLVGLDVRRDILNNLADAFNDERYRPHPLLVRLVEEGSLGKKSGMGIYDWSSGEKVNRNHVL